MLFQHDMSGGPCLRNISAVLKGQYLEGVPGRVGISGYKGLGIWSSEFLWGRTYLTSGLRDKLTYTKGSQAPNSHLWDAGTGSQIDLPQPELKKNKTTRQDQEPGTFFGLMNIKLARIVRRTGGDFNYASDCQLNLQPLFF